MVRSSVVEVVGNAGRPAVPHGTGSSSVSASEGHSDGMPDACSSFRSEHGGESPSTAPYRRTPRCLLADRENGKQSILSNPQGMHDCAPHYSAATTPAQHLTFAPPSTAMTADLPYTALRDAILVHPTMAEGLATLFRALPASP